MAKLSEKQRQEILAGNLPGAHELDGQTQRGGEARVWFDACEAHELAELVTRDSMIGTGLPKSLKDVAK